jgi:hypothetical protein
MTELIWPFTRPYAGRAARSIAGMAAQAFTGVRRQLAARQPHAARYRPSPQRDRLNRVGRLRSHPRPLTRSMPREIPRHRGQAGDLARAMRQDR